MNVVTKEFGKTKDGTVVHLYTIKNRNGMELVVSDYGAVIQSIRVPDKDGKPVDVVLGYDDVKGYEDNAESLGSFVGRNANRIKDAKVTIDGKVYELEKNDGENNLHSGSDRSHYKVYEAETMEDVDMASVEFSRLFPDMEQKLPGNTDFTVTYSLTENNEVILEYFAVSDKATVINPTNHSYFNLNGEGNGDILDNIMTIYSDAFTPTDDHLIPTGEIRDVTGTPLDFRTAKPVGRDINEDYLPLKQAGGYDHNFVLKTRDGESVKCAELVSPKTGIKMEVFTDLPGMQVYSGNFLENKKGKGGKIYNKRDGICFETQFFPNACNEPEFKSPILPAGKEFESATIYKFSSK
ncbi:MAG: aldose epimerase family protein [Catonella sp.]|jgi:aldose 1-epimerase|nr:aldose epimerase family protein [Catonella sp.]MDY6357658.1 aldose epimerase family protein [Catonella sp.]